MTKTSFTLIFFALASFVLHCTNYDILNKLENPGNNKISYTTNNYIFVSSWVTPGDMSSTPYSECSGFTGYQRADCACTKAAEINGKLKSSTHKFYAWLSADSQSDAVCRLQGLANACATSVAASWFNTQGQLVASSLNALVTSGPLTAIRYAENGGDFLPDNVWTGTGTNGYFNGTTGNDCSAWSDSGVSNGTYGDRTATTGWTNTTTLNCSSSHRIYCVAAP